MYNDIVIAGELYERLEAASEGRLSTVRLPIYRPVTIDCLGGEALPLRPTNEYEEWKLVYLEGGGHAWWRA
jgi:hypothetical protein